MAVGGERRVSVEPHADTIAKARGRRSEREFFQRIPGFCGKAAPA